MRPFKMGWVLIAAALVLVACGGSGSGIVQPTADGTLTSHEGLSPEPTKAQGEAWIQAMRSVPTPEGGGCFEAHYPTVGWIQVECAADEPPPPTQPPKFMLKRRKKSTENVNDQPDSKVFKDSRNSGSVTGRGDEFTLNNDVASCCFQLA